MLRLQKVLFQCLSHKPGCLPDKSLQMFTSKGTKDMITLPSHLRAPDRIKPNSNIKYTHLSFSMPIELVMKVDTTKTTVQWRFVINNIYDSFVLIVLEREKVIF